MLLGVRREPAARFTFLLAIPAILAAAGKESLELRHMHPDAHLLTLFAVGAARLGLVGYVTIKYFLRFLARHRLDVFAYYRLALAAVDAGVARASAGSGVRWLDGDSRAARRLPTDCRLPTRRLADPTAMFQWIRRSFIAGFSSPCRWSSAWRRSSGSSG